MKYSRSDIAKGFIIRADAHGVKRAVQETAALLLESGMHAQMEQILADIAVEYAKQKGFVEAEVKTAFKLSSETKRALIQRVKQNTGAERVTLHETIDKSLLGGMIVSAPDMELDISLRTKLAKLKA